MAGLEATEAVLPTLPRVAWERAEVAATEDRAWTGAVRVEPGELDRMAWTAAQEDQVEMEARHQAPMTPTPGGREAVAGEEVERPAAQDTAEDLGVREVREAEARPASGADQEDKEVQADREQVRPKAERVEGADQVEAPTGPAEQGELVALPRPGQAVRAGREEMQVVRGVGQETAAVLASEEQAMGEWDRQAIPAPSRPVLRNSRREAKRASAGLGTRR
jgi:hypothetical protein